MASTPIMRPTRSFLFVPGNKDGWIEKAAGAGADALILDLEDSVPSAEKAAARGIVAARIGWLADRGQRVYVRINRSAHIYDLDDLLAIALPGLEGVFISKPNGPEDTYLASALIGEAEARNGLASCSIGLVPLLESARSMELAFDIASLPRVTAIVGASAKNADTARALNYIWSPDGRETLYLKSRVVMAARAAGKRAIGGLWQQIRDMDGLRTSSERDRQLGLEGELVLHPSSVAAVNEVYTPDAETVAFYRGMIEALDAAQREGRASVMYEGEHIDMAHVKTAHDIIALAESLQTTS